MLLDWGVQSITELLRQTDVAPNSVLSSTLGITQTGSRRVAAICEAVGASVYIADSGSARYLNQKDFPASITVIWQDWDEPTNTWPERKSFAWRDVSSLNLLARGGPDELKKHLQEFKCSSARPTM
jgi:hypothetical protein